MSCGVRLLVVAPLRAAPFTLTAHLFAQDAGRGLRRFASQLKATMPHRAFIETGVGHKTTFILGMPRVKAVQKKARHMKHGKLRRVMSTSASYGAAAKLFSRAAAAAAKANAAGQTPRISSAGSRRSPE